MRKSRIIILLVLVLNMLMITGCWNYREIENLSIVAGLAIDKRQSGSGYHLTFDTVDVSGGAGKEKSGVKSKFFETEGDTIFDAVRNAIKISDKKLTFADCKIVVIGSEVAESGISQVLDWLNRDSEPRNDIDLAISKEKSAQAVLVPEGITNQISSYEIDKAITSDNLFLSKSPYVKLYEANDILFGDGISLALPALKVTENMESRVTQLDGAAVFKKDKFEGFIDGSDSKFLLFATNKVRGGVLTVNKGSKSPDISLEIHKNKTKVTPICSGNTPQIKLDITMQCYIAENQTDVDYDKESQIESLESEAEKELETGVKQVVLKVQNNYDSDIFGFGNSIYQNDFEYWQKIKPDWDKIFKNLKVDVNAEVEIENTATNKTRTKAGD